ncbi:MAG: chorismate synthase [Anaerolineaceae bacterium]|nr:chorismate synthase [Anaerolineaceae bacterium]
MSLRFLTAGESHGPSLSVIIEGLPAGLALSIDGINRDLARRQAGFGAGARMKIEHDTAQILSGLMDGQTTGSPLAVLIQNLDHSRWQNRMIDPLTKPRPGHADLTGAVKYGYNDLRPALERASARETAARVVVGAVSRQYLDQFGIRVGGYVCSIGDVVAPIEQMVLTERISKALDSDVSCPDEAASENIRRAIRQIMQERDTLGGIIEVAAINVPIGLGSYVQWDRRLDARLAAAVLSIPAIKGVEIGPAFENTRLRGTQVQDGMRLDGRQIIRTSNRAGGLEGGVSNGQPILVRVAMKPIATTLTPQETIDLQSGQETLSQYERSDFCPVPRAVVIVEAMVCYVLADALLEKLGGDSLSEMKARFEGLKHASLSDLKMDGQAHEFWKD